MKKLIALTVFSTASLGAHAIVSGNGVQLNGLTSNALSPNGFQLNGVTLNALTQNGLKLNGIEPNALSLNGISVNGIKINGLGLNGLTLNGLPTQQTVVMRKHNPLFDLAAQPLAE